MRKTKTIAALFLLAVAFASCSKKEGVVVSKNRVDCISAEETLMMGDVTLFDGRYDAAEQWHWDGNELYRIDYSIQNPYSENFFYDKHKRICRTTVPAYGIVSELHYDGAKLDRIECMQHGILLYTIAISHDDKHITEMEWRYHSVDAKQLPKYGLMRLMMGDAVAAMVENTNTFASKTVETKGQHVVNYSFEWADNNISKVVCNNGDSQWSMEMTYDDNYNPYTNIFGHYELNNNPFWGFRMMSENNIRVLTNIDSDGDTRIYTNTYEYNDHFPSDRTMTTTYVAADRTTLEETSYTHIIKEHYTYK